MEISTAPHLISPLTRSAKGEKPVLAPPRVQETVSSLRYERKYIATGMGHSEVALMLKLNPAVFSEIYHRRFINNIYLDTPFLDAYHETQAGIANRKKVRIRWYGEMAGVIAKPVLEFKIKRGLSGYKVSLPLVPFTPGAVFSREDLKLVLADSRIPEHLVQETDLLEPTLLNRYERRYFLSGDKKFRATIDTRLTFHDIYGYAGSQRSFATPNTVVELKYACEDDQAAERISYRFPFRVSRNSKYATGIELLRY